MHSKTTPNDDDNNQTSDSLEVYLAPPRSFTAFLTNLENGEFHAELSTELQELAAYLQAHANSFGGKPKGSMKIELNFSTEEGGAFEVRCDFKTTKPKMRRHRSIMWTDAANNLLAHNPRKMLRKRCLKSRKICMSLKPLLLLMKCK
jgi:hypothetical protein